MKALLFISAFIFMPLAALANEPTIEHQCVPAKYSEKVSQVNVVFYPGVPYGTEFLEVFGPNGRILQEKVQYSDDMDSIYYGNENGDAFFSRDWPVMNESGPGNLQLEHDGQIERYPLNCWTPKSVPETKVYYTDIHVPFQCENVSMSYAEIMLKRQCESRGKTLAKSEVVSCSPSGDDGGYVTYFTVTVVGSCL